MTGKIFKLAIVAALFIGATDAVTAAKKKAPPPSHGNYYVSFLWLGESENRCAVMDSLIMRSENECLEEYDRLEADVKKKSEFRIKNGAVGNWGVLQKCMEFPDIDSYNSKHEEFKKQCGAK